MVGPGEIAAFAVVGVAALAVVARTTRGGVRVGLIGALILGTSVAAALVPASRSAPPRGAPGPGTALGYVSSSACLGCHPGEHASFKRTFHRTMTQHATTETVRAPLDGRPLAQGDRTIRLEARGDEVWATLPDPDAVIAGRPAADVTRRVLLTTGSHREQAYWVAGERRGDLRLVPFVWMISDGAFVPRREAFLVPPDAPMPPVRWASSCIACHSVAGEPRHDLETDAFDTRAAELGITCEACHGPGAAHVEKHRDPVARYVQHASKSADSSIVQPRRLPPERSAAVCGQCHAYAFPRDEAGFWTDGYSRAFRAGDPLEPSRFLVTPETMAGKKAGPVVEAASASIFWPDGAVRVGGREYNGLVASPCYERGAGERKLTCVSCHAMHAGDPAGQIAPDRTEDRACSSCHAARASDGHARHAAGSPGAACVSCHMPKTSYALLSAVRSHRIDSPDVGVTLATGRPNACNLCHLDRSLAWTAQMLTEWYGRPSPPVPDDLPVALRDGLAGDAGVRALIADALGSRDARVPDFRTALLEQMANDPYAAVRRIAERSLCSVPRSSGSLDATLVRALLDAQDRRPITIAE